MNESPKLTMWVMKRRILLQVVNWRPLEDTCKFHSGHLEPKYARRIGARFYPQCGPNYFFDHLSTDTCKLYCKEPKFHFYPSVNLTCLLRKYNVDEGKGSLYGCFIILWIITFSSLSSYILTSKDVLYLIE